MDTEMNRSILRAVIDELPKEELNIVYKMFSSFINDYQDRHLTKEELVLHNQALSEDEWFE